MKPTIFKACFLFVLMIFATYFIACSDDSGSSSRELFNGDSSNVTIVIPASAKDFIKFAAEDLSETLQKTTGTSSVAKIVSHENDTYFPSDSDTDIVILAGIKCDSTEAISPSAADDREMQGFAIIEEEIDGKIVIRIESPSEIGVSYGLYDIAEALGAVYYHPRESRFLPLNDQLLPTKYQSKYTKIPATRLRGYHQHTQHPLVWSDFLLKADDSFKIYITEYLRYLLRNRQNVFEWHMLNTVDLDTWKNHAKWISDEAKKHGIKTGVVISFADKQQNGFQLLDTSNASLSKEDKAIEYAKQITDGVKYFIDCGLDIIVFQFGSTELTSQPDAETLSWFDMAANVVKENNPEMELFAWIHTPSHLKTEDGSMPFYHLPLKANENIGLYIHTTMYYDLEHPAPVYGNDNFHHQKACFTDGVNKRQIVYYPETAWWLGFDNSLPIFLPITNYSRAYDVQNVIPPLMGEKPMDGHVTFTTGIEWNYWMFDHYLTKLTWDEKYTWEEYADDISKMYGEKSEAITKTIKDLTNRQVEDFYGDNPMIFYYLAGESQHDELGAQAGLTGRPVKLDFWKLYNYTEEEFGNWQNKDYKQLEELKKSYADIFSTLADAKPKSEISKASEITEKLLFEFTTAMEITSLRAEQAHLHYGAVIEARLSKETEAYEKLKKAEEITAKVKELVGKMEESIYRYPLEYVSKEKPESLTAYKFGYLWETSTAFFWERRDKQVKTLLDIVFEKVKEEFEITVEKLYSSDKEKTEVLEPELAELGKGIITDYIPTILFAISKKEGDKVKIVLAEDLNDNGKPDIASQVMKEVTWNDSELAMDFDLFSIVVGSAGSPVGKLNLQNGTFTAKLESGVVKTGVLTGNVMFSDLETLLINTGMFTKETAWEMIAPQFGLEVDVEPRPTSFDIKINNTFNPLKMD